jgi:CRISP-associated protein Cas1
MLDGRLGLDTARLPHADRHGLIYLDRGRLSVESGACRLRRGSSQPKGRWRGIYRASMALTALLKLADTWR